MGNSKTSKSAKELFLKNHGNTLLAAARVVLFGERACVIHATLPPKIPASAANFEAVNCKTD